MVSENLNPFSLLLRLTIKNRKEYLNHTIYLRHQRFYKKISRIFFIIRRLRLKLSLNKYKFEEKLLYKLSLLISKYYGKKVEFNIVNLKSISYNSDIFTEILTLKLKKDKSSPMRRINSLLSKVVLSKVNTIIERGRIEKQVDFELIENKFQNLNINDILTKLPEMKEQRISVYAQPYKDNLNKLLYNLYYKTILTGSVLKNKLNKNIKANALSLSNAFLNKAYSLKLRNIILENIKYKNMGGARLRVKGRLTRRYRADRAVYKLK